jgi:hypothetical protein
LLEDRILHVETNVCGVVHQVLGVTKFDDPWMRVVQPVICQTVLATLLGAWGLGETVMLRVHACLLPVGRTHLAAGWILV